MDLNDAITFGLELGADFVEIREEHRSNTGIRLVDGVVRENSTGVFYNLGIRVLYRGGWGLATVGSPGKVKEAVERAVKLAKVASKGNEPIEVNWPSFTGKEKVRPNIPPWEVSNEDKLSLVREQDKLARLDKIRNVNIVYRDSKVRKRVVNSIGTETEQEIPYVIMYAYVFSYEAGITESAFESKGGTSGLELFRDVRIGELAAKRAVESLKAKPAPAGSYTAILGPKLAGVFIHEAFGHAAEADAILEGMSVLEGKLGQKVGIEEVNVIDDPTVPGLFGSYFFDDEGSKAKRKYIVKDGVLSGYMHSLETASKLRAEPTGNARAMDTLNSPIVRMSNTFIDKGDWKFDEMLSEIKEGIYAFGSLYGYVMPEKGQFMFKAEGGWWIEKGELKERLREVAISGLTLEVLHNIDAVGNDLYMDPGFCGKEGQYVPVTTGAPHVRISRLVFGGR